MNVLPNPFYYLDNFQQVLEWISSRYSDLLLEEEAGWISAFHSLPQNARALLVRMVMRKGTLFRSKKLTYAEIGCVHEAASQLVNIGWVDDSPLLHAAELYGLLNKPELGALLQAEGKSISAGRKADLYEVLQARVSEPILFHELFPESDERIYHLSEEVDALCNRIRLMFFGNPHQGWTEFVLADLGIFRYEKVAIDMHSRAFQSRDDVDAYLLLHACRERFDRGEPPEMILPDLDKFSAQGWLASRQAKFVYRIAYHYEQAGELNKALDLYRGCSYPGTRLRMIRVLEKTGEAAAAYELVRSAEQAPESDEELQKLQRVIPRLRRKLGMPKADAKSTDEGTGERSGERASDATGAVAKPVEESRLTLPFPGSGCTVEEAVRRHLDQRDAPAFYVENALINSLFGLLCWEAIFHPLPGAFFHPFHIGPADLHSADFHQRRLQQFSACLSLLDSGAYKAAIQARYEEKSGIQSPFVFWGALDSTLLGLALDCIPAAHLRHWFQRILKDTRNNRTGFPDLIQFWPQEKRYRMIEVKGPGDRVQDNQARLHAFAYEHGMPVAVCHVSWAGESA